MGVQVCGIFGFGLMLFVLCDKLDIVQCVVDWFGVYYLQNQEGFVYICWLDMVGVCVVG